MSFDGIGGAKIYPAWNGPGTVKAVLIGADYAPVSEYLIQEIQEAMMPVPAEGYGIAPIGHTVDIASAIGVSIAYNNQCYLPARIFLGNLTNENRRCS